MVRVRIAPSPTGIPHIGNTRTALFNYLFAKHHGGKFLLRIEDTDQARLVPESEKAIKDIMEWLGLGWDEEYVQSKRLPIYREHAEMLLKDGRAYQDEGAIRFRMDKDGETTWTDGIGNKKISFQNNTQEDFVMIKSDGYPTYNFANVIDDHLMEITHVFRGEEFISSTPKHLQLYKAFGWEVPVLCHLSVILGNDKQKLSKRHGAKSALDYKKEGYLKEALVNFMALLGWNPGGDREIMSMDEMIKLFDLPGINTANPIFDMKKLEWMNGHYIRLSADEDLAGQIFEYYDSAYDLGTIKSTIPLAKERMKTLADYGMLCQFFYTDASEYEIDMADYKEWIAKVAEVLADLSDWKADSIGEAMQKVASESGLGNSKFFMMLRVAITGRKISPPLNESMELLGKETVLRKLKKAL